MRNLFLDFQDLKLTFTLILSAYMMLGFSHFKEKEKNYGGSLECQSQKVATTRSLKIDFKKSHLNFDELYNKSYVF
jgi:hypothetical protein